MYPPEAPDTFGLDFANITLTLVTLVCALVVLVGVVREIVHRVTHRKRLVDDHTLETPGLGVTMADGGEPLDR